MSYSRRRFLGRCGVPATVAAFGSISWTSLAQAAEAAGTGASICLAMTYPNSRDLKFDGEYFRDKHMPLLRRVYGDSLERIELRQAPYVQHSPPAFGARPPSTPPAPPIKADVSLWIRDLPAFAAATQKSGAEVQADFANVTDSRNVVVQYDQLVASDGLDRKSVTPRTPCICAFYPNSEGAHFDAGYYVNAYMPKLKEAVGDDLIKRIEVYKGAAGQAGAKALYVNSVHTYVKNLDSWNQKMFTAGKKLMAEGPNYTSIFPMTATLEVFAAG